MIILCIQAILNLLFTERIRTAIIVANATICEEDTVMPALMHNISAIYRCSATYRQGVLSPLGLKPFHAAYLISICKNPGITQDQLAKRIFVDKSNVTRQVSFLEEAGFVERRVSPCDRRVMQVFPTQKAEDALPLVRKSFRDWEALVAADLTEQEKELLIGILEKMKQRAAQWMEED